MAMSGGQLEATELALQVAGLDDSKAVVEKAQTKAEKRKGNSSKKMSVVCVISCFHINSRVAFLKKSAHRLTFSWYSLDFAEFV